MRLALISDTHGNLPALDAVLADIVAMGVDAIVNLGDILSGPLWPAETAERLMPLRLPTVRGNHERQLLQPLEQLGRTDRHTVERLQPGHLAWIAALPATLRCAEDAVLCCHGTPGSDLTYGMESLEPARQPGGRAAVRAATEEEVRTRMGDVAAQVIVCGHSHVPRVMQLADGRLVVNPGSVGLQAYDDDHGQPHRIETGAPHARYAVIEREMAGWSVQLRAVAYDWEAAARQAEAHGRPDWAVALRTGRMAR